SVRGVVIRAYRLDAAGAGRRRGVGPGYRTGLPGRDECRGGPAAPRLRPGERGRFYRLRLIRPPTPARRITGLISDRAEWPGLRRGADGGRPADRGSRTSSPSGPCRAALTLVPQRQSRTATTVPHRHDRYTCRAGPRLPCGAGEYPRGECVAPISG